MIRLNPFRSLGEEKCSSICPKIYTENSIQMVSAQSCHLHSNRNFGIFSLNGKHSWSAFPTVLEPGTGYAFVGMINQPMTNAFTTATVPKPFPGMYFLGQNKAQHLWLSVQTWFPVFSLLICPSPPSPKRLSTSLALIRTRKPGHKFLARQNEQTEKAYCVHRCACLNF